MEPDVPIGLSDHLARDAPATSKTGGFEPPPHVSLARNNAEQTTAYRYSGNEIVRKLRAGPFLVLCFRWDQKRPDRAQAPKPGLMFNRFDPF